MRLEVSRALFAIGRWDCVVSGRSFFKYLDEHASTLNQSYDPEELCCTHAGHVWMPVRYILTAMKINPSTYERKFLNPHQLFDDTSYRFFTYLRRVHNDLTSEEEEVAISYWGYPIGPGRLKWPIPLAFDGTKLFEIDSKNQ